MKKEISFPDFIQIPYQVAFDKNLQPIDQKLYGIIYWFSKMKAEKCIASNMRLGELCQTDGKSTIPNSLVRLEERGYIKRLFKDKAKRNRSEIIPLVSYAITQMSKDHYSNEYTPITQISNRIRKDNKNNKEEITLSKDSVGKQEKPEKALAVSDPINENSAAPAKLDPVQEIMNLFYEINPALNFANKTQRGAADWMVEKWGIDKVKEMTAKVIACQGQEFAPVATNPYEMKEKLARFAQYFNRDNKPKAKIYEG